MSYEDYVESGQEYANNSTDDLMAIDRSRRPSTLTTYKDYANNSTDDILANDSSPRLPTLEKVNLGTMTLEFLMKSDTYTIDGDMEIVLGKMQRVECADVLPGMTAEYLGRRFDAIIAFAGIEPYQT